MTTLNLPALTGTADNVAEGCWIVTLRVDGELSARTRHGGQDAAEEHYAAAVAALREGEKVVLTDPDGRIEAVAQQYGPVTI